MESPKKSRSDRGPKGPTPRRCLGSQIDLPSNYSRLDYNEGNIRDSRQNSRWNKSNTREDQFGDSCTSDDSETDVTTEESTMEQESSREISEEDPRQTSLFRSMCFNLLKMVVIVIIAVAVAYFCAGKSGPSIENLLHTLKEQFNEQDSHIWDDISSGLNDVVEQGESLSIFILLSYESGTMDCLAKSLGHISSTVLGTNDYIILTPTNIGYDTGEILSTLKERIAAKKVVVVQNLLNMNAKVLEVFHNLCDRHNPLIEQTVYIITIVSKNFERKRPQAFVEALISDKLSGSVDQDKIAPLVTRITDGSIIEVQPEQHMANKDCLLNL